MLGPPALQRWQRRGAAPALARAAGLQSPPPAARRPPLTPAVARGAGRHSAPLQLPLVLLLAGQPLAAALLARTLLLEEPVPLLPAPPLDPLPPET